jgi:hypothetical protein
MAAWSGRYTFELRFDEGSSLFFSLVLLLHPDQVQAVYICDKKIDAASRHRFRLVVPAGQRGELRAHYRTESQGLVNARHRFERNAGTAPRGPQPPPSGTAMPPPHLDANGNLRRVRILAMDGGGVRGTAEVMILTELLRRLGELGSGWALHRHFDLICGTSTGGLFALGLGIRGMGTSELKEIWCNPSRIFKKTIRVLGVKTMDISSIANTSLGRSGALEYDHEHLEAVLEELFQGEWMDTTKWLGEHTAKVCVVSHLLDVLPLTP